MRVPIPMEQKNDSWFWILDEKGMFTVRSCYRQLQGVGVCEYADFWKCLWSLKLPGKVRNFLWRVCKGFLPTMYALTMKQVDVNIQCPWCHSGVENATHVLFECGFARTVWQDTEFWNIFQILTGDTPFDILRRSFAQCNKAKCVLIGMLCWSLWNRRNNWVWDKANGSAFGVKAAAYNLLNDWREAQTKGRSDQQRPTSTECRVWSKPTGEWLKVNTDATGARNGGIGIGCVIRNSQGQFVGARARRIEGDWHPNEAEAISLKEALSWCKLLNLNYCIFETDSKILANACSGRRGESYFDTIVSDCQKELKHFDHVRVEFVYRSANCVAHLLAKVAHSMSGLGEWHVTPPEFLNHVLDSDHI